MTNSRIKISDLANGGKEFVAPAMRNFQEKKGFFIVLLILSVGMAIFLFVVGSFLRDLPFAWARFLAANFFFTFFMILALPLVLLGFLCVDVCLRSTRVLAISGELRIVTHWLFVQRTNVIPVSNILEITADNNTTADGIYYYDIMVLAKGVGKKRLTKLFYAFQESQNPSASISEKKMEFINAGGKKIRAITNIIGQTEADAILQEINQALGRE
jgi:hypothetical protein